MNEIFNVLILGEVKASNMRPKYSKSWLELSYFYMRKFSSSPSMIVVVVVVFCFHDLLFFHRYTNIYLKSDYSHITKPLYDLNSV